MLIMPLIKNTNELNDHITFIKIESVNGPDPSDETETELFSCWVKIKIRAQNSKDYKGTTFEVTMEL